MPFFSLLLKYLGYQMGTQVKGTLAATMLAVRPHIQHFGLGLACFIGAAVAFFVTFLFFLAGFFLLLIQKTDWSFASLWTALVAGIIGALCATGGVRLLRKPLPR